MRRKSQQPTDVTNSSQSNALPQTPKLPPVFIREHYEVYEWRRATAVLKNDFSKEWDDIGMLPV